MLGTVTKVRECVALRQVLALLGVPLSAHLASPANVRDSTYHASVQE